MAVMWAYILDDEAVAKAAALFVGQESDFVNKNMRETVVEKANQK